MVRMNISRNVPNFAAWSNENLAKFALESYLKLQDQEVQLEELNRDFKDAMKEIRRLTRETTK
jgi:hypothetical protein